MPTESNGPRPRRRTSKRTRPTPPTPPTPPKSEWYKQPIVIILGVLGGCFMMLVFMCILVMMVPSVDEAREVAKNQNEKAANPVNLVKNQNKKAANPVNLAITFSVIRRNLDSMTELQWDRYTQSIIGEKIQLIGTVATVGEPLFGGEIEIEINMESNAGRGYVQFTLPEKDALILGKDDPVKFMGQIKRINKAFISGCTIKLDNVEFQ